MDFIEEAQKQRFSKVEHLAPRVGILLRPVLLHVFWGMLQKGSPGSIQEAMCVWNGVACGPPVLIWHLMTLHKNNIMSYAPCWGKSEL